MIGFYNTELVPRPDRHEVEPNRDEVEPCIFGWVFLYGSAMASSGRGRTTQAEVVQVSEI